MEVTDSHTLEVWLLTTVHSSKPDLNTKFDEKDESRKQTSFTYSFHPWDPDRPLTSSHVFLPYEHALSKSNFFLRSEFKN